MVRYEFIVFCCKVNGFSLEAFTTPKVMISFEFKFNIIDTEVFKLFIAVSIFVLVLFIPFIYIPTIFYSIIYNVSSRFAYRNYTIVIYSNTVAI